MPIVSMCTIQGLKAYHTLKTVSSLAEFSQELLLSSEYDVEDVFRKALSNHPQVNVVNGGGIRVTFGNVPTTPFQHWDGIFTRDRTFAEN